MACCRIAEFAVLRALGATFLGLPVVVARAHSFIAIIARWHAQALCAAFLTEEHAWLLVLGSTAPPRALRWAFFSFSFHKPQRLKHHHFLFTPLMK